VSEARLVLIDREALQAELQEVFDARTVRTLLNVLDKVVAQVHAAGVTREDFSELKQIVAALAEAQRRTEQQVAALVEAQRRTEQQVAALVEAQRRTEQRVEELAEAQRRTEERVEELAEAQRRTEERLNRLEETMAALAEAQRRTEQQVAALAEAQRRTEQRVEALAEAQRRTEERLNRLEETVAALAEAQRRTEERLNRLEETVAALAEAQRRTEERLNRLEETVAALAEAQRRTEERLNRLEETVAALAEAQRRTEERLNRLEETVAALAEAQRRSEERLSNVEERLSRAESNIFLLTEQVRALVMSQQKIVDELGSLKGRVLEIAYRDKAPAYFGRLLRRPRVVDPNELWEKLENQLTVNELDDVLLVDLIVQGRPRQQTEAEEIWLAVEVSAVVDEGDVTRARRRAALLRQAGYRAVPVVAGERATPGAEDEARQQKVAILQDGRSLLWNEALTAWTT